MAFIPLVGSGLVYELELAPGLALVGNNIVGTNQQQTLGLDADPAWRVTLHSNVDAKIPILMVPNPYEADPSIYVPPWEPPPASNYLPAHFEWDGAYGVDGPSGPQVNSNGREPNSGGVPDWMPTDPSTFFVDNNTALEYFPSRYGTDNTPGFETYSMGIYVDDSAIAEVTNYNCSCDDAYESRTLLQLREMMMVRLGFAAQLATPPPGMTELLNSFLQTAQEFCYEEYSLFRMVRFYSWPLQDGVRFYDLPDNQEICTKKLNPQKIKWVGVQDGQQWYPLACGIAPEVYTTTNYPGRPTRYEIRQCIEVWPAPQPMDPPMLLWIKGDFGLLRFTEDTDPCTIDWLVLFYHALANAKAHYTQPDAGNYMNLSIKRIGNLVAGSHMTARYMPGETVAVSAAPPVFLPLVNP